MLSLSVTFDDVARASRGFGLAGAALRTIVQSRVVEQAAGTLLVSRMQAEAPVKTGALRQSIRYADGKITAIGYANFVAHGTRPHEIAPRSARVLAFQAGGQMVFARRVMHPGTRANDFPRRALEGATPGLRLLLRDQGEQLIRLVTTA